MLPRRGPGRDSSVTPIPCPLLSKTHSQHPELMRGRAATKFPV